MAVMKTLFLDNMYYLARKSGYDVFELLNIYKSYCDDCKEDGVPIDFTYFVEVTMEHDW